MKRLAFIAALLCSLSAGAQRAVPCVNRYVNNQHITQHQFDAMVDFAFNVGCGAFRSSSVLRDVNAGKMAAAADAFLLWTKVNGRTVSGLVIRRRREREMFLKP